MLTASCQRSLLMQQASHMACLCVLRAIYLGVQDLAVREGYARAKPG